MEEVQKRQKDLDEKTKNMLKDAVHDLSTIKESDNSDSKKESNMRAIKKNSRAQTYKLEEPESEDNPSMKFVLPFLNNKTISDPRKARKSERMPVDQYKLNNESINVDFKIEDEEEKMLNLPKRQRFSKYKDENNSESYRPNSSQDGDRSSKKSKSRRSSSKLSLKNSGLAIISVSNPKWIWIKTLIARITWLLIFNAWLLLLSLYNIVFVPLQAAYQIDFKGGYIAMEVITLAFYTIDIIYIYLKHSKTKTLLVHIMSGSKSDERHLWRSIDDEKKSLRRLKIEFVLAVISWLPLSIIFWGWNVEDPLLLIFYLKMLRLIKVLPILKLSNYFKQRALNMTRIVEMLFGYYVACHIISCSLICIAYTQPDIRTTWLRRLPVPQDGGMRTESGFEGLTDSSIYIHALDFTVNTVSHVAVGEVTMVSAKERIYNAFIILCGTFIYAFLFGNVASIMADFAPQMFYFKFHKQYEEVMSSLNSESVPQPLIDKIKDYFDYVWTNSKGIKYSEFLDQLPKCLNADILTSRYSEAIHNSIIFKKDFGAVDHALVNSILTLLEYRVYMDGDFIVIGGSISQNTYIFMEGEAVVLGLNEEFIAVIKSGGHYSNDLDPEDEDSFGNKRPLHIVSSGISIIGILNKTQLFDLYVAYPHFQETLR